MVRKITRAVVTIGLVGTCCYLWVTTGEAPAPLQVAMGGALGWALRDVTQGGGR